MTKDWLRLWGLIESFIDTEGGNVPKGKITSYVLTEQGVPSFVTERLLEDMRRAECLVAVFGHYSLAEDRKGMSGQTRLTDSNWK